MAAVEVQFRTKKTFKVHYGIDEGLWLERCDKVANSNQKWAGTVANGMSISTSTTAITIFYTAC